MYFTHLFIHREETAGGFAVYNIQLGLLLLFFFEWQNYYHVHQITQPLRVHINPGGGRMRLITHCPADHIYLQSVGSKRTALT